jgi:hypothetical protein
MTTTTIVESIALAIAEEYPGERTAAASIAEQLAAIAEADGIPLVTVAMWIRDRPRHELSAQAWRTWCKRYRFGASSGGDHAQG